LSPDPFVAEINGARTEQNYSNIYKSVMGFGTASPHLGHWLKVFFGHSSGLPVLSLLALFGVMLALRRSWPGWYVVLVAAVCWLSPVIQPAHHDRAAVPFIGAMAVLSALAAHEVMRSWRKKWAYYVSVVVITLVLLGNVFPLVALGHRYKLYRGGKQTSWYWSQSPSNWSKWRVVEREYSGFAPSWKYINKSLKPGKRVALAGNPSYYIADGDASRWLFLDSKEALPIHGVKDPKEVRDFFVKKNVQLVYPKANIWYKFAYKDIHIKKMMGSELFPEVGPGVYEVVGD